MTTTADILARAEQITPLPNTVVRLITVINDPRSAVSDIVDTIKYDQAVTARVLQLCNSAFYGLSRTVHSLDEAVRYLGAVRVLQILVAVHGQALLAKGQTGYGLEPGVLWKHSVAVALASSILGERIDPAARGLAFTAGLLHDIGKVVLNEYVAHQFAEIVRSVSEQGLSFSEAEERILGFSHQEIGAKVAEQWALPARLIRCIRYHHDPGLVEPSDTLVDTVYLANCVCLLFGVGVGSDELNTRADAAVMKRHGLYESDLELTGVSMMSELNRVRELFGNA